METAVITNIQKYSVHDGPGIRNTIFFKGCPLTCWWCHNPETQSYGKQMMYSAEKCTGCGECVEACPQSAITRVGQKVFTDSEKCNHCGICQDYCLSCARTVSGKEYTVRELMKEIEKDQIFYEQSGGGITLSGGEPMINIDFVEKIVDRCYEKGISIVVDTCGYVPYDNFERINKKVSMYLYDLKHADSEKHKKFTGVDNKLILENLRKLSEAGVRINLRIPLIDGVNTDDESVEGFLEIAKKVNLFKVNLLPYHDMGKDKYRRLEMAYDESRMKTPSAERMEWIKNRFQSNNFEVKIGG